MRGEKHEKNYKYINVIEQLVLTVSGHGVVSVRNM